jgi:hypothetical protein
MPESFPQGLSQGLMLGYQTARQREADRVRNSILQLQAKREKELQDFKIEEATLNREKEKELAAWTTFDRLYKQGTKILNPVQKQTFMQGIANAPFFQKISPDQQDLMKLMLSGSADNQKTYSEAMANTLEGIKNNDPDKMYEGYLQLETIASTSDNPNIIKGIERIGDLIGKPKKPTDISRLLTEREQYPAGTKEYELYTKGLEKEVTPSKGVTVYAGDQMPVTKKTRQDMESTLIDLDKQLNQFTQIIDSFDKEFLTLGGHWKGLLSKWEETAFGDLSPEDQKYFEAYTDARTKTNSAVAILRHLLYGTALSGYEIETSKLNLPTFAGGTTERFTESDSPTEFINKVNYIKDETERSINRLRYALEHGTIKNFGTKDVSFYDENGERLFISDPQFAPRKRTKTAKDAKALAEQIWNENPNLTNEEVVEMVKQRLNHIN